MKFDEMYTSSCNNLAFKEIYLIVHPDFSLEYSNMEILQNEMVMKIISEVESKINSTEIFFGLFLSRRRKFQAVRILEEILRLNTRCENRIIFETNSIDDVEELYKVFKSELGISPKERITPQTILTARGIYLDRCVLDHMLAFMATYNIDKEKIFLDPNLSFFAPDCKIKFNQSPYITPKENNEETLKVVRKYGPLSDDSRFKKLNL